MVDWLPWGTTRNLDILQHHHSLSLGNAVTVQREIGTANALLHGNASSHTSHHTTGTLASFGIAVLHHSLHIHLTWPCQLCPVGQDERTTVW